MIPGSSDDSIIISSSISLPQLWLKMVKGTKSGKSGKPGTKRKAQHNEHLQERLEEQGRKLDQTTKELEKVKEELHTKKNEPTSTSQLTKRLPCAVQANF